MTDHIFSVIEGIITVGVILVAVALVGRWFLLPVALPELTAETVSEIEIADETTGYKVYISDPEDIKEILPGFNGIQLDRKGISIFSQNYKYQITFYGENGIKMAGFNGFWISDNNRVSLAPFSYAPKEGVFPVEYIDQVVSQVIAESEEEPENQTN